jgi:hypothetical protein
VRLLFLAFFMFWADELGPITNVDGYCQAVLEEARRVAGGRPTGAAGSDKGL